jgi:hypothetical protein
LQFAARFAFCIRLAKCGNFYEIEFAGLFEKSRVLRARKSFCYGIGFAGALPMWLPKKLFFSVTFLISAALLLGGCATNLTTNPARSATEQLLLSTAADRALQSANLTAFANQKVFLDTTYFDSYDPKYVMGTIRDALSRAGALLEDSLTNSDIVIEARSGALSIDSSDTLFGIPNMGLPVPLAGTLQIPELAFYKSDRQRSTAKIALLAFAKQSGAHVYSSGSLDGKSYDKHYKILFVSWIRTDVPEKQKSRKKAEQYQSWFPQYDPINFPSTNSPTTNLNSANLSSTNAPITNLPPASPVFTNAPPLTPMNTNTAGM